MSSSNKINKKTFYLSSNEYDAFIFDLDGVITQTAKVHALVWKQMFDEYLKNKSYPGQDFVPFDINEDYLKYVDGKPRYEGVRSFLGSRGIELPFGSPDDSPEKETVCGLGNRKNQLFREYLKNNGVETYGNAVDLVHRIKDRHLKTAVVSSSKNCSAVLEAAGLTEEFDVQVDGVISEKMNLKGKPNPDIFLEAAKRLNSIITKSVVVEDALAGVEAGRRGGFGCVIGVDRTGRGSDLKDKGADIVVSDLSRIIITEEKKSIPEQEKDLPNILENMDKIHGFIKEKQPAFFLDYDGTLTPIVQRPEDAVMSNEMRSVVSELSGLCPLAVISGRDLKDVKNLVKVDNIFFAGSHGFDIAGPDDWHTENQRGQEYLPILETAETEITERLKDIPGARVERKKFSIATHYREVSSDKADLVEKAVDEVLAEHPELRKGYGKKVFEMQPDIDWDKGKALLWLLKKLDLDGPEVLPFYIGDD
ncbi:MAG: trehalose-phosphatase, partial [Candidatus Aminicenantes bacterium]|nr:trehalose-phosphatase [Candidatus Aminicenantes bacterium]